jgi:hypothetical protein
MPTSARHLAWLLPVLLCGCKQQLLQGSFRCPGDVKFHFNRQTQTAELNRNGQRYQAVLEEKGMLTWPRQPGDQALPDTFAMSRKDPKVLMLYGGFAGTGLACQKDAG